MFGWFRLNWQLRLENEVLCDEIDAIESLNEEIMAENIKLREQLKEARRQSDAFEAVSREACDELETLKKPKASKPGKKG